MAEMGWQLVVVIGAVTTFIYTLRVCNHVMCLTYVINNQQGGAQTYQATH